MGGGESRFDEEGVHSGRIGQNVVGDGFVGAMMMGQLFPAQEMGDDDIRSRRATRASSVSALLGSSKWGNAAKQMM